MIEIMLTDGITKYWVNAHHVMMVKPAMPSGSIVEMINGYSIATSAKADRLAATVSAAIAQGSRK